jgi:hypothetical protein
VRHKLDCDYAVIEIILIDAAKFNFFVAFDDEHPESPSEVPQGECWLLLNIAEGKMSLVELLVWEGLGCQGFQFEKRHGY